MPVADPVSAAAFCKARRKLRPHALRTLLHAAADAFDRQHGLAHQWHGRRVLAVDGSRMSVQRAPDLWSAFGGPTGGFTPQIMVTTLFDVIAKLPIDATVTPCNSSEREQLSKLVERLRPDDIVLLDRGYPSFEVVEMLRARRLDFVMRVPTSNTFSAVEACLASGQLDATILLAPSARSSHQVAGPISVRMVRREGPGGEAQCFLTSLPSATFPRADILALYRRRWEVELFFRVEKGPYVGHEQFHARTSDGVCQEVFAFLLFVALSRTLMAAAAEIHAVPYERISQKGALLATAARLTLLLLYQRPRRARTTFSALIECIARCLDAARRQRAYPRRSFKPRPRWGPNGNNNDRERRAG